jgi:uncharacterized FlgJ-related protein
MRPYMATDAKSLADDREFLIDCLYAADPGLRSEVMARLSDLVGRKIEWKVADSDTARDAEIQALRDQVMRPTTIPAGAGIESGTGESGK